MTTYMTIGEFSRLAHLSIKALRHYHDVGLLEPHVDPVNSYRLYSTAQVPAAHLIRRLRELDMPLPEIKAVLDASDGDARHRAILAHLQRMEQQLARTHDVVSSLRSMLEHQATPLDVEHRAVDEVAALAIRGRVTRAGMAAWCEIAFPELHQAMVAAAHSAAGPASALFANEFFEHEAGEIVVYVPVAHPAEPSGRVEPFVVPAATLAVAQHAGSYQELDRTYGALGTHVAVNAIGAPGPIREHYLVGPDVTDDVTRFRTEVCWPIDKGAM